MAERYLIVSNPPHDATDFGSAATCLGMSAADFRIKANFPVPEIWSAHNELGAAQEQAGSLLGVGIRVALVPASVLDRVPATRHASGLFYGADGCTVVTESGNATIGKTDRVVVVSSESVPRETRPAATSQSLLTQKIDRRRPLSPVGGLALSRILGEVSPELARLEPMDLASRLAFLTSK